MDCPWRVAFDSASEPFPWHDFRVPIVFLVIDIVILAATWHRPWRDRLFAIVFTVVTVGFIGGIPLAAELRDRHEVRREARTAAVVEGVVQQFHPMPYSGHDTERFAVGGVHFAYTDFEVSAGFHNTSSHGGPITEGLHVRIHYIGSATDATIVRLELPNC